MAINAAIASAAMPKGVPPLAVLRPPRLIRPRCSAATTEFWNVAAVADFRAMDRIAASLA